jgi:uncharacterized protein
MRVSSYVIGTELPKSDFFLLLHGYTGAVDKVPKTLGQALIDTRGGATSDLLHKVPQADLDTLAKRGYITELSVEAERQLLVSIALQLHTSDLTNTPAGFMFVPAYTCNLRCPYCFQPHEYHQGQGKYSTVLSRELVDAGFRIGQSLGVPGALARSVGLLETSEDSVQLNSAGKSKKVGLFGGEPLSSSTEDIVRYIAAQAAARGMILTAITNGVELARFTDLLGPFNLAELQITLDGTAQTHDHRRVGPGFKQTFARICDNIDLALSRGVRISLRMNVDSVNAAELESLSDFCSERGWTGNHLFGAHAATVSAEGNYRKGIMSRAELVEKTMDIAERKTSAFYSYEKAAKETLENCLFSEGYAFKGVANCSAESGLLMFDPFGDVYSCWEEIGDSSLRVATYCADGIMFEGERMARWLSRFPGAIDECSRCPYALIHLSGCGKHAADHSGTIFANACESFQEYFPRTLSNVYDAFEAGLQKRPSRFEPRPSHSVPFDASAFVQITMNPPQ